MVENFLFQLNLIASEIILLEGTYMAFAQVACKYVWFKINCILKSAMI